jgi:DNA-binding GntR family transcriptional regulator
MAAKLPGTNRSRLVDEILDYLREQIYSGEFPPGMQLRQERLSEELDISRTPLREALRVLQSEGLLLVKRGNRVEVIGADLDRFRDLLAVREVVDGVAARLAADRHTPRLATALQTALDTQRAALEPWDRSAFAGADAEFHGTIFRATQNPYVIAEISLVRLSIQVFQRGTSWGEKRAAGTIDDHERIAELILAGEGVKAEQASRAHIRRVFDDLDQVQRARSTDKE